MFCSRCGTNVPQNAKFCPKCGMTCTPVTKTYDEKTVSKTGTVKPNVNCTQENGAKNTYGASEKQFQENGNPLKQKKFFRAKSKEVSGQKNTGIFHFNFQKEEYTPMKRGKKTCCVILSVLLSLIILLALLFAFTFTIAEDLTTAEVVLFLQITVERFFGSPFILLSLILIAVLLEYNIIRMSCRHLRMSVFFGGITAACTGVLSLMTGIFAKSIASLFSEKISDIFLPYSSSLNRMLIPLGIIMLTVAVVMISIYCSIRILKHNVIKREEKKHFPYHILINIGVPGICVILMIWMALAG